MSTSEQEAASEPVATPRIREVKTVFGLSCSNFRLQYLDLVAVTSGYSIWTKLQLLQATVFGHS